MIGNFVRAAIGALAIAVVLVACHGCSSAQNQTAVSAVADVSACVLGEIANDLADGKSIDLTEAERIAMKCGAENAQAVIKIFDAYQAAKVREEAGPADAGQ